MKKWFSIGIGVKRWVILSILGISMIAIGIAYAILKLETYTPLFISSINWVTIITLFVGGFVILTISVIKLSRNVLAPYRKHQQGRLIDVVYAHSKRHKGLRLVAIGGGTGLPSVLRGFKAYTNNITAVVTMADDGGSSGRLRRELGVLPPGDLRNNIAALADDEKLMTQLFQYRFSDGDLGGHAYGNLFIAAMAGVSGSLETALTEVERVLNIQGRVLPATLEDIHLIADIRVTGKNHPIRVFGESKISETGGQIESIQIHPPDVHAYSESIKAILEADLVVIGPGSLFTSIIPNLLVNGSTGIAVGMATNIPPHNLREITAAAVALADDPNLPHASIMKHIAGPDFPTGGQILNSKVELRQIYEDGHGAIRVRGEYKLEEKKRGGTDIVITSIPYAMTKSDLVEKIAEVILARKLPYLLDVRDESTTDVRIVLEIKRDADPVMVMAYLYKHTPLQSNFHVNLTCLVPPAYLDDELGRKLPPDAPPQPRRLGIKAMLRYFLDFRYEVTCRRFEYQLAQLRKRIHILEGFRTIFDALDETIKIIRASDGKEDAAGKIIKRFKLSEIQTEAILELKLYKLAKLEIRVIREELAEKTAEAKKIEGILKSETKLWGVVKDELKETANLLGTPRRTKVGGVSDEQEFDADAFIVDEDAHVVVTRDGWIKRAREIKDPSQTRVREGDAVMAVLPGSTKEKVVFFTSAGSAYVIKINDITPSTGYGDPAQKYFKFDDGERIVAAYTLDPRALVAPQLLAVTKAGLGFRFATAGHMEVTTKAGRRYAKPAPGDEVLGVVPCNDTDTVVVATRNAHVLQCAAGEIAKLEGAGRGVTVIKTSDDDAVIGFACGTKGERLTVEAVKGGKRFELVADPKAAAARGGKGHQIIKKAELALVAKPVSIPSLANADGGTSVN